MKKRATIAQLKGLMKTESPQLSQTLPGKKGITTRGQNDAPAMETDIQQSLQLQQLKNEAVQIQREIIDIKGSMKVYQRRVDETPRREQELRSLERDYSNIQEIYSSLMDRRLEAELSVNMEKKQKGEQFRVLDSARLPQRPISPDVNKLFIFSTAAGLGVAGVIVFLLVFFDNTVRRDEDIEGELGLPILASVAPLKKRKDRLRNRLELIGFILMAGYALFLLAGFAFVNIKGLDQIMGYLPTLFT